MKTLNRWKLLTILLTFAILLPGCYSKKNARAIKELKAPEPGFITSAFEKDKGASFMLLRDGTFCLATEENELQCDLLQWEYELREDRFISKKKALQAEGATATTVDWHDGDPYPGTQINYHEYDDVDYKEYVEDSFQMLYYGEYFDDYTYKLKERPNARVKTDLYYNCQLRYNEADQAFWPYYSMDDAELGKCYQRGFEMAFEDPEMKEALLSSVNADAYSTGREAVKMEIGIVDQDDGHVEIRVAVYMLGNTDWFYKEEQWN